jgi:hypothetical protein
VAIDPRPAPAGAPLASWRKFRRKTSQVGLPYTAQLLFKQYVPNFLFAVNALVITGSDVRNLRRAPESDPNIRWATADDIDLLVTSSLYSTEQTRALFARDARSAILVREGELLACMWLEAKAQVGESLVNEGWLRYGLSPGDFWTINVWVTSGERGRDLYSQVRDFAASDYARAGFTRLVGAIDSLNRNSLRAGRKKGARLLGRLYFLRFLGFTLVRFAGSTHFGWWGLGRRFVLPVERFN